MKRLAAVILLFALTGCSSLSGIPPLGLSPLGSRPTSSPASPDSTADSARTQVPWEDYLPDQKAIIDKDEASGNCEGLQATFDIQDQSSAATFEHTGHDNAAIMGYVVEAMVRAGCFN